MTAWGTLRTGPPPVFTRSHVLYPLKTRKTEKSKETAQGFYIALRQLADS